MNRKEFQIIVDNRVKKVNTETQKKGDFHITGIVDSINSTDIQVKYGKRKIKCIAHRPVIVGERVKVVGNRIV